MRQNPRDGSWKSCLWHRMAPWLQCMLVTQDGTVALCTNCPDVSGIFLSLSKREFVPNSKKERKEGKKRKENNVYLGGKGVRCQDQLPPFYLVVPGIKLGLSDSAASAFAWLATSSHQRLILRKSRILPFTQAIIELLPPPKLLAFEFDSSKGPLHSSEARGAQHWCEFLIFLWLSLAQTPSRCSPSHLFGNWDPKLFMASQN